MTLVKTDTDSVLRITSDFEFFTLFTKLDITSTRDHNDDSQKDFESLIQVIGLRTMPALMYAPLVLNGEGMNQLEHFGAPSLTGDGWVLKFAFSDIGKYTIDQLVDDLNGIVLNAGVIDTKTNINMEFTKQDNLYEREE